MTVGFCGGALEPLFRTRGNGGVSFVEGASARSGCSEQRKSSVPAQRTTEDGCRHFHRAKVLWYFLAQESTRKKGNSELLAKVSGRTDF